MAQYFVQITQNGVIQKIALQTNQAYTLSADTPFQIVDEAGKVQEFITQQHGNDLWIFLENEDKLPELIVQNSRVLPPAYTPANTAAISWGKVAAVAATLVAAKSIGTSNKNQNSTEQSQSSSPIASENMQSNATVEPIQTAKGESIKAEPLPVGELPPLETAKGESIKAEPLPVGELPPLETAKGESVKAEPLPIGELPPLETAKGESVKAEPLPVGELPPLETAKGESVKAEPLPVGELPPLETAKGESVKAEPLPIGELPPLETAKGESVKAEPLPIGELPPLETAKGESVKAEPLPVGELPPLETAKGESVKAEPLPVGELSPLETAKGTSVKAEPLPVGELPPLETAKGTSVKAKPLPVGELPPLETAKGTSVKAEPLPVGELPPLETAKGTSVKAEPLPVGELPPLETAKGTSVKAEPLPIGELPPLETAKGTSVKAEPLPEFNGEISVKGESVKAEPLPEFNGEISIKGESVKAEPLPEFNGEISIKGEGVKAKPLPTLELPSIITLTSVDDDNVLTPDELAVNQAAKYSLTGTLNLAATEFSKFNNRTLIDKVVLTIGDQQYYADYQADNDTFSLSLSRGEWAKMAGQTLSAFTFTIKTASDNIPVKLNYVKNQGWTWSNGKPVEQDYLFDYKNFHTGIAPTLSMDLLSVNDNEVVATQNGQFVIQSPELASKQTTISGVVKGLQVENQTVNVVVNNQQYTAQTNAAGEFSVQVAASELAQDTDTQIEVTWLASDNSPLASDSMNYNVAEAKLNSGEFVSEHQRLALADMPYFLSAVAHSWSIGHQYPNKVGQNATRYIKYAFPTQEQAQADLENQSFAGKVYFYTDENKEIVREILATVSQYTNIVFTEVAANESPNFKFYMHEFAGGWAGAAGYAFFGGNVHMNGKSYHYNETLGISSSLNLYSGYTILFHELLHSLGLDHPHEGTYRLNEVEDEYTLTFISYDRANATLNKKDMRMLDMAYLHYLYGVNPNHRADNDVYSFKPLNLAKADLDVYIWDGAGVDTFDASAEQQGVTVDLTPGSWIYSGEQTDTFFLKNKTAGADMTAEQLAEFFGVPSGSTFGRGIGVDATYEFQSGQAFIGYGTQIEQLIGSQFNDTLHGNAADNMIMGLNGDDTIDGKAGNDDLYGGSGSDTLIGGDGNDRLNGGAGDDVLTGNSGSDVFVFSQLLDTAGVDTITDFTTNEDTIELSANVFSSLSQSMENWQQYLSISETGTLSYDADGVGGNEAVAFTVLRNGAGDTITELERNYFVIA